MASSAVTRPVSLVATPASPTVRQVELAARARSSADPRDSSRVLVRLPLWPRAMEPVAVGRNVGWAFSQMLAPVVE